MSARAGHPPREGLRRAALIAAREFRERVRQRAYVIAVVVGAVVAAAAVIAPSVIGGSDGPAEPDRIAVSVEATSPGEARAFLQALRVASESVRGEPMAFDLARTPDAVREAVRSGDSELGLLLAGTQEQPTARILAREGGGGALADRLAMAVDLEAGQARTAAAGQQADRVFEAAAVTPEVVRGGGATVGTTAVVSVLGLLLYIAGIMLTTAYATGVVSDRTNRVTERLLTAAKPSEHLAGKLVGVGAAGLLQFAAWIVAALLAGALAGNGNALEGVPTELLVFFPIALVLTYVLYAAAATVLVLPVRKAEDVGGAIGPAVMLQVVAFIATTTVVAPGATISGTVEALSLVPFFSPLLILGRLAAGDVPAWELAVAVAGPLLVAALLLRLAGPAYAKYSIDAPGGKGLKAAVALLRRG